jgi:hypothetical protein
MASLEDQQKTVDTIKHGKRTYNIHLGGYGGEMVYGKINKTQYEFWANTDLTLLDYVLDRGDSEEQAGDSEWANVPKDAHFPEVEWYELDDIEHVNGCAQSECWVNVTSTNSDGEESEVFEGRLTEFEEKFGVQCQNTIEFDLDEHADKDGHNYVFYGMSVEKGSFNNFEFESLTPPQWNLLRFDACGYPNGDTFIENFRFVKPDNEDDENIEVWDQGGDSSTGKGMYAEVWDY